MTTWTTTADVLTLTGVTVTDADIAQAGAVIDVCSGVTYSTALAAELSARDLRLLGLAVAYQAAWAKQQVDLYSRTDVSRVQQDGVTVDPANPDALFTAPLAARALAALSWNRRNRSTKVRRPQRTGQYRTLEQYAAAWLSDESPDSWWPL